ncbi:MAG: hypothetical protein WBK20_11885 [Spirochaetota bacterium]
MAKRAIITKIIISLCVIFSCFYYVYAQFLTEDYKKTEIKPKPGLPVHIARNIKAELINEVEGAVKITFSVDPDAKNDFLIGRTTKVPSSAEVALQAATVKVVLAGAEPVAIDSNLPPGQYYYVVLARDKILEKDVSLYPDVNYTSAPIVIKKKIPEVPQKRLPEQITLLYARVVNKTQVLLTWKGVQQPNIVYNVYRATEPLNSPERIKNAKLIGQVQADNESFIDRTITQSGKYFYAVTVRDIEGNEDVQLIPDQSYTANPVSVIIRRDVFVTDIRCDVDEGALKITWNKPDIDVKSFVVYRHTQPIVDAQALAMATKVATVESNKLEYVDKKPVPGSHYFAVLAILEDGSLDTTLKPDSNYTTKPVVIGAPIRLKLIEALEHNGLVKISWSYTGSSGSRYFKLFRSQTAPTTSQDVKDAFLVDVVNVTANEYTDSDIPAGTYYYILVPETYDIDPEFKIIKGINCTAEPVKVTRQATAKVTPVLPEPKKEEFKKPEVEPEKEKPREEVTKEKPQQKLLSTPNVNKIIAATFYKGKYESCIDALTAFVQDANEPEEVAKANLFIGRSYIELKQYKVALKYIMKSDVAKYYPKEAKFWRDFALSRVQ